MADPHSASEDNSFGIVSSGSPGDRPPVLTIVSQTTKMVFPAISEWRSRSLYADAVITFAQLATLKN